MVESQVLPLHYFNRSVAPKEDAMLQAAIRQGYVPAKCLLSGPVVMSEVQSGRDPCAGCECAREKCGGRGRDVRAVWANQFLQRPAAELERPVHPILQGAPACPFCASNRLSFGHLGNYVHCDTCGADGPEVRRFKRNDFDETCRQALALWQTRGASARN